LFSPIGNILTAATKVDANLMPTRAAQFCDTLRALGSATSTRIWVCNDFDVH